MNKEPQGSANGAGGDAPKLLLTEGTQGELYLDGILNDDLAAWQWLVKFRRN
jgi:serine/threonine-protein kinase HipA